MSVAFVFTNPGHHLEMMSPVAAELEARGVECQLVSLAELRGFDTPPRPGLRRAIPLNIRKRLRDATPTPHRESTAAQWGRGGLAKSLVWQVLQLRLRYLLREARVVVIPNDSAYPYLELLRALHGRGVRTVLMQEGIRFSLPEGYSDRRYGRGGSAAICAWGEGSREYFIRTGVSADSVIVTGTPRYDAIDRSLWRARGEELLARLGLRSAPIVYLSNPIETAGYGSKQQKLELFARFLEDSAALVRARQIPILVKHHMHEASEDFARVAAASPVADRVHVVNAPAFAVLAIARAAVVLGSTVGLEALIFGVPLAQLEIPDHGFVFEYVQHGAATPLSAGSIASGLETLLDDPSSRRAAADALLERHLHARGRARHNVADVIERVLRAA